MRITIFFFLFFLSMRQTAFDFISRDIPYLPSSCNNIASNCDDARQTMDFTAPGFWEIADHTVQR